MSTSKLISHFGMRYTPSFDVLIPSSPANSIACGRFSAVIFTISPLSNVPVYGSAWLCPFTFTVTPSGPVSEIVFCESVPSSVPVYAKIISRFASVFITVPLS